MTCVLAYKSYDAVYLVADTLILGDVMYTSDKIVSYRNFSFACAGGVAASNWMKAILDPLAKNLDFNVTYDLLQQIYIGWPRDNTFLTGEFLFVNNKNQIYRFATHAGFSEIKDDVHAIGAGACYALGAFAALNLSKTNTIDEIFQKTFEITAKYCSSVNAEITIDQK